MATATVYSRHDCQGQRHHLLAEGHDHAHLLDRAQVSALAKQVMDGQMSWLEAQSRLDDMIDAATLPSFGAGNGKAVGERVPVVASAKPMTERASDPLDELFE